jgi:hypothetical protein
MVVVIQMPGGDLEYVVPNEFQWMREAFDEEWSGTVMLRVTGSRLYSIESLDDLRRKFRDAGVGIADFAVPEGERAVAVNARGVREVEPANPVFHHQLARAVLKFGPSLSLAVRQTVGEARALLAAAGPTPGMEVTSAQRRIRSSRPGKVAGKRKTIKRRRTG